MQQNATRQNNGPFNVSKEDFTLGYFKANANLKKRSPAGKWALWAWKNVVLLNLSGNWRANSENAHMDRIWEVFEKLMNHGSQLHTITDISGFKPKSIDLRDVFNNHWQQALDQGDLSIAFLDSPNMRESVRQAIADIMDGRVRFFKDHQEAFDHIYLQHLLEATSYR